MRLSPAAFAISGAACTAIFAATLRPDFSRDAQSFVTCIICGERGVADALVNMLLFAPLGVGLALARVPLRRALLAGALLSGLVELAQTIIPGRDPSVGDLLFNTLGTGVGCGIALLVPVLARLDDRAAARLSVAASLALTLTVLLSGWLLQPSFPRTTYWGHWTPMLGHLEWYRGRVLSARIAGHDVRPRRIEDSEWARTALLQGSLIEVDFTGGPPVPGLASLFNVSDETLREIVLLGPDRHDLVFRYRTRSTAWGLDQPDLRIADGWPAPAPGEAATIRAWSSGPGEWCLASSAGRHCGLGFTFGAAWGILFYTGAFPAWLRLLFSTGWAAILALPVGFLMRRRWESTAALAIAVLAVGLLPPLLALRPTSAFEWLGVALGLAGGALAARSFHAPGAPGST